MGLAAVNQERHTSDNVEILSNVGVGGEVVLALLMYMPGLEHVGLYHRERRAHLVQHHHTWYAADTQGLHPSHERASRPAPFDRAVI